MSRPATPHPAESTGREQAGDLRRLDYLPLAYDELLALEEELAVSRLGRPRAAAGSDVDEADVARTFMELSALVGHVLSVYQRHYAGEAYISTAKAASSLVRHAHRLAYQPDPGLAASGHVVLHAKEGVSGTVAARLPLASVPLGDIKAQDYETGDDLLVDAALNELLPVALVKDDAHILAERPVVLGPSNDVLRVQGTALGLEPGDPVALVGPLWRGMRVARTEEDPVAGTTTVHLDRTLSGTLDVAAADPPPALLARPALRLRPFAADADPVLYPPAEVQPAGGTENTDETDHWWYTVARADGTGHSADDVYLSEQVRDPLVGTHVMRSTGASFAVFRTAAENVAAVTLHRRVAEQISTQQLVQEEVDGSPAWVPETVEISVPVTGHVSATVTAVQLANADESLVARSAHPFPAEWLAGWALEAPLAATEPNPEPVADTVDLPGVLPALTPGRPLVLTDRAETVAQVVAVRRAELLADTTRIWFDSVTPGPDGGWRLHDLKLLGNVSSVSHGRTVEEALGGSDGVSAFQRFALSESPLTMLPGVAGGEPELEVRVDEVRWERVEDFALSGPDDRHFRAVIDEQQVTSVVFGDGRNGAVPPSGRKNVAAVYRVGLGRAGDVEPGRLTRLRRAHPLLDRVANLTPVGGGAEPADAEAIRSQSTRWIRTFDRAVSVSDLADLALTMPGVARAASRWDQALGAILVVATAAGEAPAAMDAVRTFVDARRDVTVPLVLRGPAVHAVQIDVELEADPAYHLEVVRNALRSALHGTDEDDPGMFTFAARGLGQPAFRSEVYARLEAVPGVVGVRIKRFSSAGTPAVLADVLRADVDEWLRLDPNDLTVT